MTSVVYRKAGGVPAFFVADRTGSIFRAGFSVFCPVSDMGHFIFGRLR